MLVEEIVDVANAVSHALEGEDIPPEIVTAFINQVLPEVIWNDFLAKTKIDGWTVGAPGDEFDEDKRVDPGLVSYGTRSPAARATDAAVYAVVQALVPYITDNDKPVVPLSIQTQTPKQRKAWEEENDVTLKEVDGKLTVVQDEDSVLKDEQEPLDSNFNLRSTVSQS